MIFKSYLIEKDFSQIAKVKSILFYGENIGLKKHFKYNSNNTWVDPPNELVR